MKSKDSNTVNCRINGTNYSFQIGDGPGVVAPSKTLAEVLRGMLLLTGTKTPCNHGACGGCTVLMNGKPTLACSNLMVECDGAEILTIEGLRDRETGALHPIQQAFIDLDAVQCGMCTPGMVLTAKALLDENPNPDRGEVSEALSGNICRCTGYEKYIDGVMLAARVMREMRGEES